MDVGIATAGMDITPPTGDSVNPGDARIAKVMGKKCKGKYCPVTRKLTKEGSINWECENGKLIVELTNNNLYEIQSLWNELANGGIICHTINDIPIDENFKLIENCISFLTDHEMELQLNIPLNGGLSKVFSELNLNISEIVDIYRKNFVDELEYGTLNLYTNPHIKYEFTNNLKFLEPKINYILEGSGDKINSNLWETLLEAYVNNKITLPNIKTFLTESEILMPFEKLMESVIKYLTENDITPVSETYYVNLRGARFIKESVSPNPEIIKNYKKVIFLDNSIFISDYSLELYSEETINWLKSKNLKIYNNYGKQIII